MSRDSTQDALDHADKCPRICARSVHLRGQSSVSVSILLIFSSELGSHLSCLSHVGRRKLSVLNSLSLKTSSVFAPLRLTTGRT